MVLNSFIQAKCLPRLKWKQCWSMRAKMSSAISTCTQLASESRNNRCIRRSWAFSKKCRLFVRHPILILSAGRSLMSNPERCKPKWRKQRCRRSQRSKRSPRKLLILKILCMVSNNGWEVWMSTLSQSGSSRTSLSRQASRLNRGWSRDRLI